LNASQSSGFQFKHHERFAQNLKRTANAKQNNGDETESRIVMGMTENDDKAMSVTPTFVKTPPNQRQANTLALPVWMHSHRRERRGVEAARSVAILTGL
jgi:hypothetical protein